MDFRTLRDRLGLKQSGAAAIFGVDLRTWQNWEGGRKVPGPALRLARLLAAHPELAAELG